MARSLIAPAILVVLLAAQPTLAAPPAGPLGHWTFDQAQGELADDRSGHGNTGDVMGPQWATGPFGTALHFAGKDSYVSVPQLANLDGSPALTVEAWVLWTAGGRYPNILTGGQWSPGGFMIFVRDEHCSFRMGRPAGPDGQPALPWQETSAPLVQRIETGRWYHLAATFQRPTLTTYLNGQKVASVQWDHPVACHGDLEIGRWSGPACHQGLIDEVKIFNRALSADEVRASYAAESPRRSGPNPVAYKIIRSVPQPLATLENPLARLQLDRRGRCIELVEKRTGRNLLAQSVPLATLTVAGKALRPTACTYADNKLRLEFGPRGPQAVVGCAAKDRYFTFTLLDLQGPNVERLTLVSLPLQAATRLSNTSGAAVGDDWGVCLRAMNLQTDVGLGGAPLTLRATCTSDYGLVGAQAALVVASRDELLPALQQLVRAENLPRSSLGGPQALDAQAIRGAYLFAHPAERDVERWIDLAKRGGFTHLHFDGWYKSLGHYEPHPALFPHGLEGMKEMVRKVHAAGLKAGMHTLTGCIQTNDPWVTPVPDKRLAADASYTLAAAIDAQSDTILTTERPQNHDVIWSYSGRGNALRIGDEIVLYSAISATEPYGFLQCKRGAFGTRPAAHTKDQPVDHLRQIYLAFYPDDRTTLVGEVADAIARVYNECQFDQIYMDGSEGMGSSHAVHTMRDAIYRRLKRPAIVEASCWDHWSWYYHSRIGAWDHPKWGLKAFTDLHCASIPDYRQGALLQAQLGWWVVLGASPSSRAETPDEMEYFCAKTLAFDAPSSTQGIGAPAAPANARMQEYLTRAGWYERLRLANYFSDHVKEQLRQPGQDYHLVRDPAGQWQLLPTDYLAHKVAGQQPGSTAWTVANRFAEQPLAMRLEALYAVQPYNSPQAVLVADADAAERFTTRRAASDVSATLARSTEQAPAGQASLRFTATSRRAETKGAWAQAGMVFEPYLNLRPCDALGVWVHGDGKGEVLNLQLTTPREYSQAYAEHYVTIDFTGWRYVEIPLRERDAAQHRDYGWPYFSLAGIYMTSVNMAHVNQFNLYLGNLPPNDTATVHIGPVKALRTARVELRDPVVELNGQPLRLPVTLTSGDYLELDPADGCRLYDERGTLLERVALGPVPRLKAGPNRVAFACRRPEGFSARAELTVAAYGPPLAERNPAHLVDWSLLREEYDVPRVVTRLDGRDNRWEVLCRQGDRPVPFGVEIDVQQVGLSDAAYNRPDALALERFDTPAFVADPAAAPADTPYDPKSRSMAVKPGVTQTIELSTEVRKIGRSAARYSAASTLTDAQGWSVVGRRLARPLDLSKAQAIGFWLHGDGKGQAFKLQFRDNARGYCDMVTPVNFVGWRYQQFDFNRPGNLDRSQIQHVAIYYNSLPAGDRVTCYVDEIRALSTLGQLGLRNPQLTVGDRRLVFLVDLAAGERLVFDGRTCRIHRAGAAALEWIQPQGGPVALQPGRSTVELSFDSQLLPQFRAAVSLVKHYP